MSAMFGWTTLLFIFVQQVVFVPAIGYSMTSNLQQRQRNSNRKWLSTFSSLTNEDIQQGVTKEFGQPKVGIIIVDHGSKRSSANNMLLQVEIYLYNLQPVLFVSTTIY